MIISQIQFIKVWIILLLSCTRLCTYQPNLYSFDIQSTEWMFSFFLKDAYLPGILHVNAWWCLSCSITQLPLSQVLDHSNVLSYVFIITWILTVIIVTNTEKKYIIVDFNRYMYIYIYSLEDLCKSISSS